MAFYSRITRHRSYLRAASLAATYLKNPQRLRQLLERAQGKASEGAGSYLAGVGEKLAIPVRMLKAWLAGDYKEIPWGSLLLITAAIIYFVMPMDLMPDILPMLGFVDDLALISWTLGQVRADMDRFLAWERQSHGVTGQNNPHDRPHRSISPLARHGYPAPGTTEPH